MTKLSQLSGDVKPIRTVSYTSGSGVFTPLAPNSWCRVTLIGGGDGGAAGGSNFSPPYRGGGGGASGATCVHWVRVSGPTNYVIGAGGTRAFTASTLGGLGGATSFGSLITPTSSRSGTDSINNGNIRPAGYITDTTVLSLGLGLPGSKGSVGDDSIGTGGLGGRNFYGSSGALGQDATGFGAGGNGGSDSGASPFTRSGNGAGGLILIEEFGP